MVHRSDGRHPRRRHAAGVYTTNEPSACKYVATHSEARVVVLEDTKQLDKYLTFRDDVLSLQAIVMWAAPVPESANAKGSSSCPC